VVGNFFQDEFLLKRNFVDWLEVFLYLQEKAKKQKFVIAIDEYPYLAETDKAVSSVFQKGWDEYLKNTQAFMILCGSSIAMMESELLSHKAPLFGRFTGQLHLRPMPYDVSQKFFPKKSFEQFLSYYAITGGMPAYMRQFAQYDTPLKAITELCWNKQGLFYNEVRNALKQELRSPNNYFAILKSIAFGKTRLTEIANDSGLNAQLVNKYLDVLEKLQVVIREVPVTEDKPHKSKKGIYVLTENFVRFWFQYVYAFLSDIEIGNLTQVKKQYAQTASMLQATAYEQIARDHLQQQDDNLFLMNKVGRYWNNNVEIDGIGFNIETKQIVFMEAKWSNSKQGLRELNQLREKAKFVPWNLDQRKNYYALYSKAGFSKELKSLSQSEGNILLVHQLKVES
jgi:uncharacterized protein